jgi:hypothetical protein
LWGDRAIAGLAIDRAFDLDKIRDAIPLATFAPVPRPGADHPDIILVTIDTVRADHTPPYGGHAEMPTLAALADRGAVFDWAFSPSNVTRRSIPAMITGLGADRVRGRVVSWALRVDPRHVLLAERLHAAGYDTAGFMCCESFWGPELHTGLSRGLEHLEIEHDGAKLAKRARAWLEQRSKRANNRPLFLWIHILEPHNWSANGEPPANERDHVYDRVLAQCDAMLADVTAFAKGAIVIVTADHGEGLGEHGHLNHSTDLYDSQIHVPLVLAGPHVAKLRRRDRQHDEPRADRARSRRLHAAERPRDRRRIVRRPRDRGARVSPRRPSIRRDDQRSIESRRPHRARRRQLEDHRRRQSARALRSRHRSQRADRSREARAREARRADREATRSATRRPDLAV